MSILISLFSLIFSADWHTVYDPNIFEYSIAIGDADQHWYGIGDELSRGQPNGNFKCHGYADSYVLSNWQHNSDAERVRNTFRNRHRLCNRFYYADGHTGDSN